VTREGGRQDGRDGGGISSSRWAAFYDAVVDRPPHETIVEALDRFEREGRIGFAVDLGCGDGRETVELVRRGWRVLAIDGEPEAIERLRRRVEPGTVETAVARFEDAVWPDADLVNEGFSLPFCPPAHFGAVWRRIRGSLLPGGRFSGQLFGDRDGWAGERGMTFHAAADAELLFDGLELERFEEVEVDGQTAVGDPKHWHVYHVVARRPVGA
jgi:SAM-dependent methyltransferase